MIFFVDNEGKITKSLPETINQGSANANSIYVVAPFVSMTATIAFKLPDGAVTEPFLMTEQGLISGLTSPQGKHFCGWSMRLPNEITAKYGTVTAQIYFYNVGIVFASTSTSFIVTRGVEEELPETPTKSVYQMILGELSQIRNDLRNGFYTARSITAYNNSYTYTKNDIIYYDTGDYGVFLKSLVNSNSSPPYNDKGELNGTKWELVIDFNDYYARQTSVPLDLSTLPETGLNNRQARMYVDDNGVPTYTTVEHLLDKKIRTVTGTPNNLAYGDYIFEETK